METIALSDYIYPLASLTVYIVISILKQYPEFIDKKHYPILAVMIGVMVVIIETSIAQQLNFEKVVSGAISGLLAIGSYELIKHSKNNKDE